MSLLKAMGFIKEDPAQPAPQVTAPIQTPTPAAPVKTAGRRKSADADSDVDSSATTSMVTTNKDVEKRLRKAAENSGGEGFDFAKFVTMVKKNSKLGEDGAFAAALSAAETMGVSTDELCSSATTAIKAVNAESKKIDADLAEQAEQNTTDQTELKKINSQITSLTNRKEILEGSIEKNTAAIQDSQNSLEATVELVVSDMKDVVSKIKKYSK